MQKIMLQITISALNSILYRSSIHNILKGLSEKTCICIAVQTMFLFFKTKALDTDPIGIVTLTGNCSLIVSAVIGTIFWHEPVSLIYAIASTMLIASVILCTDSTGNKEFKSKLKLYVTGFFISAAMVGPILKIFFKS